MKTGMIGIVGLAAFLATGLPAMGQETQPLPQPANPMQAFELRNKQLDVEQRQSEMHFNDQMRNIQVEKKRLELEHDRQMLKDQEQKAGDLKIGPGKDAWHGHEGKMKHLCGLMLFCMVVHILLAIWVYQDIRKRNAGSGMWIVVTLLTGLLGALVYAVVRIGDKSE